jgi:thiol-disulfide isomerase/thioredoxin
LPAADDFISMEGKMVSMQLAAMVLAVSGVGETVLLDFSAPWCGPCRNMESTVSALSAAGYPVRKIDIDRQSDLANRYHVTNIPCFVLVADGREVDRITGATSRGQLEAMFAKAGISPPRAGDELARGQSPDQPMRRRLLPGLRGGSTTTNAPSLNVSMPSQASETPTHQVPAFGEVARAAGGEYAGHDAGPADSKFIQYNVRLKIEDAGGYSYGSGTIIDARSGEALVLTCGHVFRDSQGKGKINIDLFVPGAPQGLTGQLISYDLKRDVGLVSFRPGVPVTAARMAPQGYRANMGDKVVSVGCNNGGQPTAIESHVTGVDKFVGPANLQVAGQPVQGRSGGGLFTPDGMVIGVCNAADPTDNGGLYAAAASIHEELDAAKLSMVYRNSGAAALAANAMPGEVSLASATSAMTNAAPPAMPGRMPDTRLVSAVGEVAATGPARLSQNERSALDALRARNDGAEVICIVRSPESQSKSEVIVLDRASATFMNQLATEQSTQQSRQLTSLEVPRERTRPVSRAVSQPDDRSWRPQQR